MPLFAFFLIFVLFRVHFLSPPTIDRVYHVKKLDEAGYRIFIRQRNASSSVQQASFKTAFQ